MTSAERGRRWYRDKRNREKAKERARRQYEARNSAGLCLRCGGKRDRENTICSECAEVARVKYRLYYKKERSRIIEHKRTLYLKRKAAGRCTICGRKSPVVRCKLCSIKRAQRAEAVAA